MMNATLSDPRKSGLNYCFFFFKSKVHMIHCNAILSYSFDFFFLKLCILFYIFVTLICSLAILKTK